MDNKIKVILIHGNGGGTGLDHWFPYIKKEFEKLHIKVSSPDFPDSELARMDIWLPFLKSELLADRNTILIGHSTGAVASMRFAEQDEILGSVLVGASYTDLGDENEKKGGYFDKSWNWEKIINNQKWILQYASRDDPYIPISEARFIHNHLRTEYYEYDNQGHFGGGGREKLEFPELVEVIRKKLGLGFLGLNNLLISSNIV